MLLSNLNNRLCGGGVLCVLCLQGKSGDGGRLCDVGGGGDYVRI